MKRLLIFYIFLSVILSAPLMANTPSPEESAKEHISKVLRDNNYAFTPAVREAYIAYVEAVIRKQYGPTKINEKTWKWFKQRPQILSAIAAADYPVEPNILLNLQRLFLAMGSQKADAWTQLALAYAIRHRDTLFPIDRVKEEWDPARLERMMNQPRGKGGDFAFQTEEDLPQDATEGEKKLGKWVTAPMALNATRPKLTIPELMQLPVGEINMVVRQNPFDPPLLENFPNWEHVAYWGKLYPTYFDCRPTPQRAILMNIFRDGRIPAKTDRPNFKAKSSDWPILMTLAELNDHIDETSFFFAKFLEGKKIPPTGLGERKTFGGSGEMSPSDLNFQWGGSNFHPRKFIRVYNGVKKDQGGNSWAWGLRALNVAATAVGAPPDGKFYFMGESGNYTTFITCADNSAPTGLGSTVAWYLDKAESVIPEKPSSGSVRHIHYLALATTLNQGLQPYEDARMALHIIDLLGLPTMRSTSLLESVFFQNPLNSDIMYRLAAEYRKQKDALGTLKLLASARAYAREVSKLPVNPAKIRSGRSAIQKIYKGKTVSMADAPVITDGALPWFFMVCNEIAVQYLRDNGAEHKDLFRAELEYEQKAAAGSGITVVQRALGNLADLVK